MDQGACRPERTSRMQLVAGQPLGPAHARRGRSRARERFLCVCLVAFPSAARLHSVRLTSRPSAFVPVNFKLQVSEPRRAPSEAPAGGRCAPGSGSKFKTQQTDAQAPFRTAQTTALVVVSITLAGKFAGPGRSSRCRCTLIGAPRRFRPSGWSCGQNIHPSAGSLSAVSCSL